MFDNIGGKIKALAKFITWAGIIGSVIAGIVVIGAGGRNIYGYGYSGSFVLQGILTMVLGSLAAWISSFVLYGFGELIEQTAAIARNTSHGGPSAPDA